MQVKTESKYRSCCSSLCCQSIPTSYFSLCCPRYVNKALVTPNPQQTEVFVAIHPSFCMLPCLDQVEQASSVTHIDPVTLSECFSSIEKKNVIQILESFACS